MKKQNQQCCECSASLGSSRLSSKCLLCLLSSQACATPALGGAFIRAQSQMETNWDGDARRGRQGFLAPNSQQLGMLLEARDRSPSQGWDWKGGSTTCSATSFRVPEKAHQTSLVLLLRDGSGPYVPLQMTMNLLQLFAICGETRPTYAARHAGFAGAVLPSPGPTSLKQRLPS